MLVGYLDQQGQEVATGMVMRGSIFHCDAILDYVLLPVPTTVKYILFSDKRRIKNQPNAFLNLELMLNLHSFKSVGEFSNGSPLHVLVACTNLCVYHLINVQIFMVAI